MSTKDNIKEMEAVLRDVLNPFREIDVEYEAWQLVEEEGWHKQVEAEWIPVEKFVPDWGANITHHYECSNCKILEYTNDRKYCSNCGAKMIGRRYTSDLS